MDYVRNRLLRETVRFLEVCQKDVFSGKICYDVYHSLTNSKFYFIRNIMEAEKDYLYIDDALHKRIDKLQASQCLIHNSHRQVIAH